jgi:hypothetical protein
MPSIVSGDSFLRGFQASPFSFFFMASFSACQAGRVECTSFHSAVLSSNVAVATAFGGRVGALGALRPVGDRGRALETEADNQLCVLCSCRVPNDGLVPATDQTKRLSVLRMQE